MRLMDLLAAAKASTKPPTKAELRAVVQAHLSAMRKSARVSASKSRAEVLVYRDREHHRRGSSDHDAIGGDFIDLSDALKDPNLLAPGRVWDVFLYEKSPHDLQGELLDASAVTLPISRS